MPFLKAAQQNVNAMTLQAVMRPGNLGLAPSGNGHPVPWGAFMNISSFDHVSVPVRDIERSKAFYREVLGLAQIPRPAFNNVGAWMAAGTLEIHLTVNLEVILRPAPLIDTGEVHFAARVEDFDATMRHLEGMGFSESLPKGDPKQLVLRLAGPAPYKQLYLIDPDNHVIEINDAAIKRS